LTDSNPSYRQIAARMERYRKALEIIASEDEGEDYDLPAWDLVIDPDFRGGFRAPAVARAALASDD
jgi:hypothetical protein